MKRLIIYTISTLTMLLSGCFKDYEKRYLFDDNRIEFEDAVTNGNASGKTFPVLGPIEATEGSRTFRVNMTGAHVNYDRIVQFRVVPEESTAREGIDFALPHGREFVIPANSSFGYIEVEFLPTGSGSPTIVLELLPQDDMKVLDRYHMIGFRFLYPVTTPNPDQLQQINDIKVYTDFVLGAQLNQNIGFLADMEALNVYTMPGATANQALIDVMMVNSTSSGLNMMPPGTTDANLNAFASSRPAIEWTQRNVGELMRIHSPAPEELSYFTNANSSAGLLAAHAYFSSIIATRQGYSSTNHGPSTRIRQIEAGDIIIYYSADREVITMFRVKDAIVSNTGEIVADVKTGKFDPGSILRSGALTIGGWSTGGTHAKRGAALVDLANIESYTQAQVTANTALRNNIDFINLFRGGTALRTRFVTIEASPDRPSPGVTSGYGITNDIYDNWSSAERNGGTFVHYQNATETEIQDVMDLLTRDQLVNAYNQAVANVPTRSGYSLAYHGAGSSVESISQPQPNTRSIVFFKSNEPGRDLYAAIVVNSLTVDASNNGREIFEVFVKSHLN